MAAFEHIKVDRWPGLSRVGRVTLSRPQAGNAMSDQTLKELAGAFRVMSADAELRAVIVVGDGKHFCAGADIEWMKRAGTLPPEEGGKDARLLWDMLSAVGDCAAPVIVAAHGAVYGGGLGLLAACDVALAADDAKFCFSEVRLGIMPAVISCFVLPKIGAANARRYYLTAEVFDAARARELGLVHEIASGSELIARAETLAAQISSNGPKAVRTAKRLVLRFNEWSPEEQVDNVIETLVSLRSGPEGQEGLAAFLEKRQARWTKSG